MKNGVFYCTCRLYRSKLFICQSCQDEMLRLGKLKEQAAERQKLVQERQQKRKKLIKERCTCQCGRKKSPNLQKCSYCFEYEKRYIGYHKKKNSEKAVRTCQCGKSKNPNMQKCRHCRAKHLFYQNNDVVDMILNDVSFIEIAGVLNVSHQRVSQIIEQYELNCILGVKIPRKH